jgi:hypothetical protein
MQLALDIPPSWQPVAGARQTWLVGDVRVQVMPLAPLPDYWLDVIPGLIRRELPAGATLRPVETSEGETVLGAPLHIQHVAVVDAAGAELEHRAAVVIMFVEWGGQILVRAPSQASLEARQVELIGVIQGGRPDFSGHIAALEQLFMWPT